ncbi:uncharacterized protein BDW70DRAFT_168792 [Aspergillus foveolatus]|uniref:uncharacterized protein n=1 Tax=Aspergillus foveolatus TaxID=210207 RepID=UPI003CCD5050
MYVLPVSITFVSVVTITVALRLFTRIHLVCAPWWDDWFLVLALLQSIDVRQRMLTAWGSRRRLLPWLNIDFTSRHYQIILKILLGLVAFTGLYMVLGTLFVCVPVHTFWDRQNVDENCVSRAVVWYLTAALQIAGDLTLVTLPMPKLVMLRVPLRQKGCLILVFALGLFVVATSAARLDSLITLVQSEDLTKANGLIATWSFVEVNVAIICASLTTFRQLIIQIFPKLIPSSSLKTGNRSDKQLHDPAIPWAPYTGSASYCADISGCASADRDSDSHTGDGIQVMRELRWELGMSGAATETETEKRNKKPESALGPDLEGQAENGQPEGESGCTHESAA